MRRVGSKSGLENPFINVDLKDTAMTGKKNEKTGQKFMEETGIEII